MSELLNQAIDLCDAIVATAPTAMLNELDGNKWACAILCAEAYFKNGSPSNAGTKPASSTNVNSTASADYNGLMLKYLSMPAYDRQSKLDYNLTPETKRALSNARDAEDAACFMLIDKSDSIEDKIKYISAEKDEDFCRTVAEYMDNNKSIANNVPNLENKSAEEVLSAVQSTDPKTLHMWFLALQVRTPMLVPGVQKAGMMGVSSLANLIFRNKVPLVAAVVTCMDQKFSWFNPDKFIINMKELANGQPLTN